MSVDEFDPEIERLFARTPHMSDAALFTAQVEQRLQKGSSLRFAALSIAALIGGAVAVRETLRVDIGPSDGVIAGDALGQGLRSMSASGQGALQTSLDSMGLASLDLAAMGGMQTFWIVAGAMIALAAAGIVRLSQEV
jgi:hypothetical protein